MTGSSSGFASRVLRSLAELREIAAEWADLWERCPAATTFQRPEWLLPWIEKFSPQQICAIEVRLHARLVGFAPFLIYPNGEERVLAFMGGGVSDYLDLLADPQWQTEIVECVLQNATGEPGWTTLDLTDLPSTSVLLRTPHLATHVSEHDTCSALPLPQNRDELLHLFSKRQRSNLRNARSRLLKAGGGQVEIATPETLPEFLDDLFRLHTTRWSVAGQAGVLHDDRVREFHRASAPALVGRGSLHLYRLRSKGRTLAIIQCFFDRDTVFCYLQGFDPEFAYFSPGTQLMFAVLENAVRLGMRKFDFLRGIESYKLHWRAQTQPTFRLHSSRAALSSTNQALAA
jgi:CelD/BcsL family acetyltransferase involved in cellulose biosynthesis